MAPSPQQRKIHFDCCFFLLVFPWLRRGAEKGARGIMSFERLFGGAAGAFVRSLRARKKACLLQFIFDQQLACVRIYLLARARWDGAHGGARAGDAC
jgi:hypothetical protein